MEYAEMIVDRVSEEDFVKIMRTNAAKLLGRVN